MAPGMVQVAQMHNYVSLRMCIINTEFQVIKAVLIKRYCKTISSTWSETVELELELLHKCLPEEFKLGELL